jgi:hypothetical protein
MCLLFYNGVHGKSLDLMGYKYRGGTHKSTILQDTFRPYFLLSRSRAPSAYLSTFSTLAQANEPHFPQSLRPFSRAHDLISHMLQ